MLKDGLYELFYRAVASPEGDYLSMMMVLRAGRILAADPYGGVCLGKCSFDRANRIYHLDVRLHVPAGAMLVTEDMPLPHGRDIMIRAGFDDTENTSLIDVAGHPVEVTLKFKSPAPN